MKHTSVGHPWHSPSITDNNFATVSCYVEITPTDSVKFELDKKTGLLKVDRPQKFSNRCPCLYGFVPQTYCGDMIGAFCSEKSNRSGIKGDDDPLDICVLTEKELIHGNILLQAKPIGGFRIIDSGEADDKIIAVLEGDLVYGGINDITECPKAILDMIKHYFLTYKSTPDYIINGGQAKIEIAGLYSQNEAKEVIQLSYLDYKTKFSLDS
ncbi:MAG: inorganic pyrophosphatase [Victivallaceae bacterium]